MLKTAFSVGVADDNKNDDIPHTTDDNNTGYNNNKTELELMIDIVNRVNAIQEKKYKQKVIDSLINETVNSDTSHENIANSNSDGGEYLSTGDKRMDNHNTTAATTSSLDENNTGGDNHNTDDNKTDNSNNAGINGNSYSS